MIKKPNILRLPNKIFDFLAANSPSMMKEKLEVRLTELAIEKTKVELAKRGLTVDELSEDQLELIVRDERDKLVSQMKDKSIGALLLVLGIQVF